ELTLWLRARKIKVTPHKTGTYLRKGLAAAFPVTHASALCTLHCAALRLNVKSISNPIPPPALCLQSSCNSMYGNEGDRAIMVKKQQLKSKPVCKVTFYSPAQIEAETVHLVGDFNGWSETETEMKR